ncbi:helix-turn-helix domain-containing protein (plasmid) [Rhodococcus pyridinivorans]|nr:helix-turn-helix domain-containing protein [Rhodococcus pyridinivorans]
MISVEGWALIRRLGADGVPRRQVARELGIGRATVDRAVASDRPPKYERKPVPASFTPFEARVAWFCACRAKPLCAMQQTERGPGFSSAVVTWSRIWQAIWRQRTNTRQRVEADRRQPSAIWAGTLLVSPPQRHDRVPYRRPGPHRAVVTAGQGGAGSCLWSAR